MTVFKPHHCLLPVCLRPSKLIGTNAPSVAAEVQTTPAQPLPLRPTPPGHKTPRKPPLPALSSQLLRLLGSVSTDVRRNPHSHKPFTLSRCVYDSGSLNIWTKFGVGVHPFLRVTTTEETTTHWKTVCWEPPGGPVVESTLSVSIPGLGTKIPASHAQRGQKKKKVNYPKLKFNWSFYVSSENPIHRHYTYYSSKSQGRAPSRKKQKFSFCWDWFLPLGREAILGCFWLHLIM